jgi:hypothetical protein
MIRPRDSHGPLVVLAPGRRTPLAVRFYDAGRCATLSLPDQLRLTALEAEDRLPLPMLDAIQRAKDLLEEVGWAVQPRRSPSQEDWVQG